MLGLLLPQQSLAVLLQQDVGDLSWNWQHQERVKMLFHSHGRESKLVRKVTQSFPRSLNCSQVSPHLCCFLAFLEVGLFLFGSTLNCMTGYIAY